MGKSIVKNYFYNLTFQIISIILPIITTPYVSRVLGAENIGIYGYTISIVTYFILFGSLGISMYAQREIAYIQDDKEKKSKLFYEILFLRFISLSISSILFYIFFVNGNNYQVYYRILLLELLANAIDISWFFQGMEEFKKTFTRNIIVKIISVVSIFVFIKSSDNLVLYFVIYVLSTLIGNASLWFYLPKYLTKIKISNINIIKHIKPTLALFIPQIAIQIYTVLDKTMIGKILGDMSEVGFYEQTQKIIKILMTIITSLSTVMVPRIAKCFADKEYNKIKEYMMKSFNFIFFLAFPMMFGLMSISNNFVPVFFGEGYEKVVMLLIIMSPILIAIPFSGTIGSQYLVASKRQKEFTISVIIGASVNFILNILLIYNYKSIGASIATVIAEFTVTFVQFYFIKKTISIKNVIAMCKNYLIAAIVMFIVCELIDCLIINVWYSMLLQIFIGGFVYIIVLVLFKDKFLIYAKNRMLEKLKISKS